MNRFLKIFFLVAISFQISKAQITYTFTALGGVYTANAAPTVLHGGLVDDATSASTAIGFNFCYGGQVYTTFEATSNGVMFLGTTGAGFNAFNDLTGSFDRPAIAPLWDDLQTDVTGTVNYQVTGVMPNRILTVEWKQMLWQYTGLTWAISFQAKLYETSNRIDFVYQRNGGAGANITAFPGASIGIGGQISGDFYSLNGVGAAPAASKITETTTLGSKPANGQIYRWDPDNCTGAPTPGTANANPNLKCANYTTTLSLTGATSACGITYQWQSGPSGAGPWTNIAGATSQTATANVTATTFYRCVLACGASTAASAPATASLVAAGACGLCLTSVTLPYTITGQTTCGQGNDITSANVTNVCGSTLYYGGEDVVYSFTPSTTGQISISITSSGSYMGAMLYQGCPTAGGTCVGNAQSSSGNQNLCPNVTAGLPYFLVLDSWPSPTCNPYNLSITPSGTVPACNMAYTVSSIAYSFDAFAGTVCPSTDDVLFTNLINFGFPFCYDGTGYTDGYIASNSAFVFDALLCFPNIYSNQIAAPGISTGYSITGPAPSLVSGTSSTPQNAILGPWHDIDPSIGGTIRYTTIGVTPNRRFVVSWENIPMFDFTCNGNAALNFTGQIKLFETSNNIEIHVGQKRVCPGWNNGQAILGLENYNGTIYRPPVNMTAHNAVANPGPYNQWTMTNTAYRYTTTCGSGGTCLVLPIGFKAFYCQRIDKVNQINWETAVEENIKVFKVERSTDAQNFTEIASVTPNNKPSKYTIEDKTAAIGIINYYRVVAYEKTGERTATHIYPLGAIEGEVSASSIYPNPVQGSFSIGIDSKIITTATMVIYDAFGKIVKSYSQDVGTGVTPVTMKVDELSAGIYILEIKDTTGQIISQQKLIKLNN